MPAAKAKKSAVKQVVKKVTAEKTSSDNALAIVSMVLGITSLIGPGLLFGVPAIVLAAIALKKDQGERGLSITGLVTGIISTLLSVLFIIGIVLMFVWGTNAPEEIPMQNTPPHMGQRLE